MPTSEPWKEHPAEKANVLRIRLTFSSSPSRHRGSICASTQRTGRGIAGHHATGLGAPLVPCTRRRADRHDPAAVCRAHVANRVVPLYDENTQIPSCDKYTHKFKAAAPSGRRSVLFIRAGRRTRAILHTILDDRLYSRALERRYGAPQGAW